MSADDVVVTVRGEIDMSTAEHLWSVVDTAIRPGRRLVIDLAATSFIDSTGLAVLVRAHQRLLTSGDELALRSPQPMARKLLDICGVDRLFTIEGYA